MIEQVPFKRATLFSLVANRYLDAAQNVFQHEPAIAPL